MMILCGGSPLIVGYQKCMSRSNSCRGDSQGGEEYLYSRSPLSNRVYIFLFIFVLLDSGCRGDSQGSFIVYSRSPLCVSFIVLFESVLFLNVGEITQGRFVKLYTLVLPSMNQNIVNLKGGQFCAF